MAKTENTVPPHVLTILGDRLKLLRKSNKKTQEEMAEFLDISRSYYGNLEAGKTAPSLGTLYKIHKYFSCSYDYLLGVINSKEGYHVQETDLLSLMKQTDTLSFDNIEITPEEKEKIINAFRHALKILNLQ